MNKENEIQVLEVEIRVIQREVKQGAEKGKKFMAYQILNKSKNYFEELRFNSKVKNAPSEEGSFILEVERTEINRIGTGNRKFPLTWISKIKTVSPMTQTSYYDGDGEELPF